MKIDLKKDLKHLYAPGARDFVEVEVPPLTYLAIDGHGDPNTSEEYAAAVAALYAAAYTIKFASKGAGVDFVVGPLEGLWTSADPASFTARDKSAWDWTMLIALPDQVAGEVIVQGLSSAATKKPELPLDRVQTRRIDEGRSLQILHVGSYDDETPTLARLHGEVMPALGVTWNGPHHEIYLGDPRKSAPDKLKTVLRQPVKPVS
ncbi:GyrI-like domain-containing protein [Nigerium massiliense]|uniref:GyrI-like domain-containing protein n=1 Tax=Nigerium massiliense TaxID=1522317 RepID=UPI00058CE7EA|nr:GyrI-like domain-containing protein [Nigerium massiliense]